MSFGENSMDYLDAINFKTEVPRRSSMEVHKYLSTSIYELHRQFANVL